MSRSIWYAEGLRWIGSLLVNAANHLERRSLDSALATPWPDPLPPHERITELRNRIHFH
ncbi:MAG TPA: hypothetical protein VM122_04745 [Usitatibacter sp.]|nr:hypothetical protein [Usitatibacter sp.]